MDGWSFCGAGVDLVTVGQCDGHLIGIHANVIKLRAENYETVLLGIDFITSFAGEEVKIAFRWASGTKLQFRCENGRLLGRRMGCGAVMGGTAGTKFVNNACC
ncbi:hypothetical protein Zmor_008410 [Zophobas morio]|uniref:Uncharacterized protein n=1 Tax=Zophobas morio TaxID=2755281 RepID=A0AA38J154_9CUCU|nr:hypothetical protein Zmor_008410 [Zophobas morio]